MNDIISILYDDSFTGSTNAVSRFGMTHDLVHGIATKEAFAAYVKQREETGEIKAGTMAKIEPTGFFQALKEGDAEPHV